MIGKDNAFDKPEPKAHFADMEGLTKLVKMGGRLEWHTRSHPNINKLKDEKIIRKELTVIGTVKKLDRKGFDWFAYPHGEFNDRLVSIASEMYKGCLSCNQGDDGNLYKLNRITVTNETVFRKKTIGVVIASYNYGHLMPEAVESVLRQTIPPNKILISDDCSEDNTKDLGEYYKKKYPGQVEFNRNKKNIGIKKHFDKAVELIDTDYVCFLGADNRFRSDYLEKCVTLLESDEKVGIAYTDFALFGQRAPAVYEDLPDEWHGGQKENYYLINFPNFTTKTIQTFKKRNFMHGSSMYKKEAYKQAGGYDLITKDGKPEDHSLFYRMIQKGWNAKRVGEPVLEYRQHSKDQANINFGLMAQLSFYKSNYKTMEKKLKETEDELNRIKGSKFWKLLNIYKNPTTAIPHYTKKVISSLTSRVLVKD